MKIEKNKKTNELRKTCVCKPPPNCHSDTLIKIYTPFFSVYTFFITILPFNTAIRNIQDVLNNFVCKFIIVTVSGKFTDLSTLNGWLSRCEICISTNKYMATEVVSIIIWNRFGKYQHSTAPISVNRHVRDFDVSWSAMYCKVLILKRWTFMDICYHFTSWRVSNLPTLAKSLGTTSSTCLPTPSIST